MPTNFKVPVSSASHRLGQRLALAGLSFVLGAALGVLVRRLEVSPPARVRAENAPGLSQPAVPAKDVPPDRRAQAGDQPVEKMLAELQSKPDDPVALARLGYLYYSARNFKAASTYFQRSLDLKDDAVLRTELGRARYYAGDPAGALAQFDRVLASDPGNVNALFNLGMIKWRNHLDTEGAIAAWQQILRRHPHHPRRAEVEQLIERARQHRAGAFQKPSEEPER